MKTTNELNKKKNVGADPVSAHTSKARQNSGITLIALVITIIVMLILVAVTITMAINGGLFEKAGQAVGDTKDAIDREQELANGRVKIGGTWYDSIDDYLNNIPSANQGNGTTGGNTEGGGTSDGGNGTTGGNTEGGGTSDGGNGEVESPEGLKVGDYVNYTPDTGTYKVADGTSGSGRDATETGYQEFITGSRLTWRVLSIDEETGEVEIVLATAGPSLTLKGADGYNHGVDILNDLCESLYSKTVNGSKVATGRSINVEDINAKTTYSPIGETNTSTGFTYGDRKQLSTDGTKYMKYPNLYSQEIGYGTAGTFNTTGLDGETGLKNGTTENGVTTYPAMGYTDGNTAGTDPYVTQTFYGINGVSSSYYPEQCLDASLGVNTPPAWLFKLSSSYWLASRCVGHDSSYAWYYLRCMYSSGDVLAKALFYSGGSDYSPSFAVRPVVLLGSDVSFEFDSVKSTSSKTYWTAVF